MPTAGLQTAFQIYPEQFWGGVVETLQQNVELFNGASQGALRLVTRAIKGDYEKESFLKSTSGIVNFRNVTSSASVTDLTLAGGEMVGVKLNKRIGPILQDRNTFRKMGLSPDEFSFLFGQQAGPQIAADYVATAITSVRAALTNVGAAVQYDATSDATPTLNHIALIKTTAKFGDRASRIIAFVMHSKNYFDLMQQQVTDKLFEVAGATVYNGTVATFGKPVVVTDESSIYTVGSSSTKYDVLGLVDSAVEVSESEERDIIAQPVTGQENLADRIQGEYAFNVRVKGFAYNTSQGINPNASILATPSTWTKVVSDNKELAGVRLTVL